MLNFANILASNSHKKLLSLYTVVFFFILVIIIAIIGADKLIVYILGIVSDEALY